MPISDKPQITEVNCETGETIVRPMTDEEYANYLIIIESNPTE